MDEIAPGIWRWPAPHPEWSTRTEWGKRVASYALVSEATLSLVDPLLPPDGSAQHDEVVARLDELAAAAPRLDILVTIPYHTRSAERLYRRYREQVAAAIWGHPAVAKRFLDSETPLTTIVPGKSVGAAAEAFAIGKPRRYETPLHFEDHRVLAFGDAVIGFEGTLRVWQPGPFSPTWYRDGFLPTLTPLLELDFERVLVTHGPPVLRDGRAALAAALAAPPWDCL